MAGFTHAIIESLTSLITSNGLLAVFILMSAESALIPIPSEVTMPFAGFLVGRGVINFWAAVSIGALGNLVGSLLAFYLGWIKGEEWVRFIIRRWGKWLFLHERDFDKGKRWFHSYGQSITFASRLLPIVRTFISLPAGIAKMNVFYFSTLTLLGSFFWSFVLTYLGLKLGQNWLAIEPYFRKFQALIVALGIVGIGIYIRSHLKRNR